MRRTAGRALLMAALVALGSCVGPAMVAPEPPPPALPISKAPRATLPPKPLRFALEGAVRQGGVVLGTAPEGTVALTLDGAAVSLAPDRRFLIAFDRDAPATATLTATIDDGRRVSEPLAVAPGGWRIEKVDAALTAGHSSAEFARLRPAELAQIVASRRIDSDTSGWRQRFAWPVHGRVSGLFGAQRVYRGVPASYHSGTDVAVPTGTPVLAPADGVVVLATDHPFTLEGNLVIVDHGMGLNSAFLHLSAIDVHVGERVVRGQRLGRSGATGRATGPHMHWGMKWRDARIDPLLLAGPME